MASRFSKSRALFVLVTVLVLAPIAAGSLSRAIAGGDDGDSFYREFHVFTEVLQHIRDRYVEKTDLDRLFAGAFDGSADALDPMATYVPADEVARYREARAAGAARSGLQIVRERGILYVVGVIPDSPAAEAGFESGDIISKLAGHSTRLTPLWEAHAALVAEAGTVISTEVLRQGQTLAIELTLSEYEATGLRLETRDGIPILRISAFDATLLEPLERLLVEGEPSERRGLIVDLRGIAGGDLETAFAAADLFVDGELGTLRKRDETVEVFVSKRAAVWTGSLVLLTNRGSQGASEVFAALLRQIVGARLVGGSTFGHAGRTGSRMLSDGAELYYTDAFFVAPDGTVIDESLAPDLQVNGASRSLSEADLSLDDLVLERALGVVQELAAEKKVA
ncbi:MAG: S41 family peptidase [Thermoanaerobaculia bacterium]